MQISLRQSLFRTLLGGILVAAFLIMASVWESANSLVQQNINQDIAVTEKVLHRLIDDRQAIVKSVSNVLLRSYDFRRAVGTEDTPSIEAAFTSYAKRINTDVIALVDLNHNVVASYTDLFTPNEQLKASTALAAKGYESGFFLINDRLLQLNLYRVEIPTLRYYLIIGIEFDSALLEDLRRLVEADIIISGKGDQGIIASTLVDEQARSILNAEESPSWLDVTFTNQLTYMRRSVTLSSMGTLPVDITIAIDVSEAYQSFTHIQLSILIFTLIAIFVALGFSMILARNVSGPVSNLVNAVKVHSADIGISLDGDADRVILCDEKGVIRDGDTLLAILALDMQNNGTLTGPVVGTVMTNLALERFFDSHKIAFKRASVGDRYILEKLKKDGGNLGGEPSGHILLPEITRCGDGLIAALKILELLVLSQKPASEFLHLFTPIPQKLVNLPNVDKAVLKSDIVKTQIQDIEKRLADKGRLLIRPSGTEPVIRVMVEAENAKVIEKTIDEVCRIFT